MPENPTPCCSRQCRDSATVISSRTPLPGSVVGVTTAGANAASITFARKQRLTSFLVNNNGSRVAGTLSIQPGAFGTTFTFTPSASVAVGTLQAYVVTDDTVRGCQIKTTWQWVVST